jgi:hypothetical protein
MINTTNTDSNKKISNYGLLLINNCVLAAMLACPFVPAFTRYFANTYLCISVILVLSCFNYHLTKIIRNFKAENSALVNDYGGKVKIKVLAWSIMVATVMLIGSGPILEPAAYSVDKFTRIFGVGMINDYSATKKIHFFYFACIIYCLLVFNVCQNIRCALINNLHNPIRWLSTFSDTLLFVGFSFLLICVYRQFSSHYQYDLTLCLLKLFLIFLIPAFYLWQSEKLNIGDVRVLLALAMFSLILSMSIVVYFNTQKLKFSYVLAIVLFISAVAFLVNKFLNILDCKVFYSKIIILSLIGGFALVFFSVSFELSNLVALQTGKFIDIEKFFHTVFWVFCWLSLACLFTVRNILRNALSRKIAGIALFVFVIGVSLIQAQPSLVIRSDLTIYEGASYSIPISDFLNYGKIPIFENFPAHMLYRVISSIAYGAITSDYRGALFAPWSNWLYGAAILLTFYFFVKILTNGFTAVSMVILLPYLTLTGSITSFGIGLSVLLPFLAYLKTFKSRYLILTVCLAFFMVAFKLDIGFSFLAGILCSSLCVSLLYSNKLAYRVFSSFVFGGLVILCMFLLTCLIKDINPLLRVQQYLSVASSNDNWGFATLGNTEKNSYSIFYFVLPFISVICFIIAILCRSRLSMFQSAVLLCLLFAYYANIPRFLMRHSLAEYHRYVLIICLWTLPLAVSYLISVLYSKKSLFILCQTAIILVVYMVFQGETFYENSPLQVSVGRAASLSGQIRPDIRKKDIMTVSRGGSRVVYDESKSEHLAYASQIKQVTDLLLAHDETFLDFTNQNAAYAWSGRKNPTYVTVLALLSGETAQKAFIRELEDNLNNVPIVIMPTDKGWYHTLQLDGINNNIRYYLVAEWIYRNYRPLIKFNDFSSVWVLNSLYSDFKTKINQVFLDNKKQTDNMTVIDWGYDNFVNASNEAAYDPKFISKAHDYSMQFLPWIWGQLDSKKAADQTNLAKVTMKDSLYSWNCSGCENKSSYLRVDLSMDKEFLKKTSSTYLLLGNLDNDKFIPLSRFRFKLKEGKQTYLFRISSDYYWSRGKFNAFSLDPKLRNSVTSVRILEGD